jgi:PPOX class probable F420-dependent enzyme
MKQLPDAVHALFDGANYAHIATLLPDGAPHSVPVWVGVEGTQIAFLTSPSSRKAQNIDRDPRVAISITQRDRPFVMAQIRGRIVRRIEGDAAWAIIDRISQKYIGQPYEPRSDRVVFLVEADAASAMSLG